jgi:hypothetical protein
MLVLEVIAARPGTLRIDVAQLAPRCRRLGVVLKHVDAGRNRLRLAPRVGKRVLGPGTYALRIGGERLVVAVFAEPPTPAEVREARRANNCRPAASDLRAAAAGFVRTAARPAAAQPSTPASDSEPGRNAVAGRVLGEEGPPKLAETPRDAAPEGAGGGATDVFAVVAAVGLLAGAIALVVAALPAAVIPSTHVAEVLERERHVLVVAGVVVALAALVPLLLPLLVQR